MDKLEEYREQISAIDTELALLFLQRMKLAKDIGNYKKLKVLPIFQPERERLVIERMKTLTKDEKEKKFLEIFFHHLMDLSKEVQR